MQQGGRHSAIGDFAFGLWVIACLLLVPVFLTQPAMAAQEPNVGLWGTDGTITAIARSGRTLYIGGAFTSVGPNTGSGVALAADTATPLVEFPWVAGTVYAVDSDGSGGWFIGGRFSAVGGVPRANAAHILANGVVGKWHPQPDGAVRAILKSGALVYIGGEFRSVRGESRAYLACVDTLNGQPTPFSPRPNGVVRTIARDGDALFVGGAFDSIGGESRSAIARLDLASGFAASWNPSVHDAGNPGDVWAMAIKGDTLFIGGTFRNIATTPKSHVAAVHRDTGLPYNWSPTISGPIDPFWGDPRVAVLAIRDTTLIVGGHFTSAGGQVRAGIAELDTRTGMATSWNPEAGPWVGNAAGDVYSLLIHGDSIYVGGSFQTIGGASRVSLARIDLVTGVASTWNPNVIDGRVFALDDGPGSIFVGGDFRGIGPQWKPRRNLAAIDLETSALKSWAPNPDGLLVSSLTVGTSVYVGGHFITIGGQDRPGLAAVDTLTGLATAWRPEANDIVDELIILGDTLFASGSFTTMGGVPRGRLASFDLKSGALTGWNPDVDDDVYAMEHHDGQIYVGGIFQHVSGSSRNYLASVDRVTGLLTDWIPNPDDWVTTVRVVGDQVFAGGAFTNIGGLPRFGIGAVSVLSGQATPWRADLSSIRLHALESKGDTLFLGGEFTSIAGEPRMGLGALLASTGAVLPWNPDLGGSPPVVWSLTASDHKLFVGGSFDRQEAWPTNGLTSFEIGSFLPPDPPSLLSMASPWPNPSRGGFTVRFTLPAASPVSLSLYDVAGRKAIEVLKHSARTSGIHEVPFDTRGMPAGVYFCRLETSDASTSKKVVILE